MQGVADRNAPSSYQILLDEHGHAGLPQNMAVSPDGRFLYVSTFVSEHGLIQTYRLLLSEDGSEVVEAPEIIPEMISAPSLMHFREDSEGAWRLYYSRESNLDVWMLKISKETGLAIPESNQYIVGYNFGPAEPTMPPKRTAVGQIRGLTIDSTGRYLYVGSYNNFAIHRFELNPDGSLNENVGSVVMGGRRYGFFEGTSDEVVGIGVGPLAHHPTLGILFMATFGNVIEIR